MLKKLIEAIIQGNTEYFYASRAWKRKRKEILRRDNNECQHCKAQGKYHKAECVHHIKHLKDRPDLALTDNNLISLCYNCHSLEHPEKMESPLFKEQQQPKIRFKTEERW